MKNNNLALIVPLNIAPGIPQRMVSTRHARSVMKPNPKGTDVKDATFAKVRTLTDL